jgi:methanogenic corrinoid protein MtbC1
VAREGDTPAPSPVGLPQGAALAILRALGRGSRSVNEIVSVTGLAQSNVSNHLARFRQRGWVEGRRSGRQIHYQIAHPAISAYLERSERSERSLTEAERERLIQGALPAYIAAAAQTRQDIAEGIIEDLLDEGMVWQEIYLQIFVPALRHVGELWARGELSVAAEHAATAFTQRIMSRVLPRRMPDARPIGTAVVGCVEGERHSVGARIAADFFQASGWEVRFLGADVPSQDFVRFVRSVQPELVGISATVDACEHGLRLVVAGLHELRGDTERPLLIAGGQWFDRHPDHGLSLDLCGGDLSQTVLEATHRALFSAREAES